MRASIFCLVKWPGLCCLRRRCWAGSDCTLRWHWCGVSLEVQRLSKSRLASLQGERNCLRCRSWSNLGYDPWLLLVLLIKTEVKVRHIKVQPIEAIGTKVWLDQSKIRRR